MATKASSFLQQAAAYDPKKKREEAEQTSQNNQSKASSFLQQAAAYAPQQSKQQQSTITFNGRQYASEPRVPKTEETPKTGYDPRRQASRTAAYLQPKETEPAAETEQKKTTQDTSGTSWADRYLKSRDERQAEEQQALDARRAKIAGANGMEWQPTDKSASVEPTVETIPGTNIPVDSERGKALAPLVEQLETTKNALKLVPGNINNATTRAAQEYLMQGSEYLDFMNGFESDEQYAAYLDQLKAAQQEDLQLSSFDDAEARRQLELMYQHKAELEGQGNSDYVNSQLALVNKQIADLEDTLGKWENNRKLSQYSSLANAEDFEANSGYESQYNKEDWKYVGIPVTDEYGNAYGDMGSWINTGDADELYEYINGNPSVRAMHVQNAASASGDALNIVYGVEMDPWQVADQMTDEEKAIFNYIYKTRGQDEAHDYFDFLKEDLNRRNRLAEQAKAEELGKEHPLLASLMAIAYGPTKMTALVGQGLELAATGDIDPNAPYNKWSYMPTTMQSAVSQEVEKVWGKAGTYAYDIGMSVASNLYNMAVSGGLGGAGAMSEGMVLALMGSAAAADTVLSAKDKGLSGTQAILLGAVNGLIEIVTEKIGFDNLYDNVINGNKPALTRIISQILSEGSEEGVAQIADDFADILIAGLDSERLQLIQKYQQEGYAPGQAIGKAFGDLGIDTLLAIAGGAISGGFFGVGGTAFSVINDDVRSYQYEQALGHLFETLTGTEIDDYQQFAEQFDAALAEQEAEAPELAPGAQTAATEGTDTIPTENAAESLQAAQSETAPSVTPEQRAAALQGLQSMAATLGENGGKAMTANFDESSPVRMDDYVRDFSALYNAAREGREVKDYPQTPYLTQAQQLEAFKAGRADRAQTLQTAPANATMETEQTAQPAVAQTEQTTQPAAEVTPYKQAQLEVLQNADVTDEWLEPITSAEQIKTYAEAVAADRAEFGTGVDFDLEAAEQALSSGEITVYSPRAITAGSFVTPSRVNAEDMAGGGGRIYSMTVPLDAVAWTDAWSGQYTGKMEGINNGREGNGILSDRSERNDGSRAGEQAEGMVGSAGQARSGNESGQETGARSEAEGADSLTVAEEKVTSADLGIKDGRTDDTLQVVTDGTSEDYKRTKALAEKLGYKVTFVKGAMHVEGVKRPVRGVIRGKNVFIQMDDPDFTGYQILQHEHAHDLILSGEIDENAVRDRIAELYGGRDAIDTVARLYAELHSLSTAEEAWTEIVCDSYADMNAFAKDTGSFAAYYQQMLQDVRSNLDAKANTERGPPAANKNTAQEGGAKYSVGKVKNLIGPENITLQADTNLISENIKNGRSAVDRLIAEAKHSDNPELLVEKSAMFRTDLGSIDFRWGRPGEGPKLKKGSGLAHIIEKRNAETGRGVETAYEMVDVIANATQGEVQKNAGPGNNRIKLHYNGKTAILTEQIGSNKWLLTGWEDNNISEAYAAGEGHDSSGATAAVPTQTRYSGVDAPDTETNVSQSGESVKTSRELDADYMAAVNSGDMETAQRMVDEAAKAAGYTIEAYHGTTEEFNEFFPGGVYFTDDYWNADGYASGERVIDAYLKIQNPLVIDAQGAKWDNLDSEYGNSTRGIVGSLAEKYDGVIFENINDSWIDDENGDESTVYWVRESAQAKSADPVTYDDEGNVIPLSKRFNPENQDIRFSSALDVTDEERQQHVKEALDYFGKTYSWNETGWLTPDGDRIDFSGKRDGARGGSRTIDHRDIADALGDDYGGDDYSGALFKFMGEGNVRISPESGGINVMVEPTAKQYEMLERFIEKYRGEVFFDVDNADGVPIHSMEWAKGTRASKVIGDIQAYFRDGAARQSVVAQFHSMFSSALSHEALEEQNEQLRKDLQAATAALARAQGKAAYWEGQTKRSKAPSPDPTDISRLAHELVGSTDTNLKANDIKPELTELAEFIMRGGDGTEELTFSGVKERAVGIAHRMLENYSELTESSSVTDYKDIRRRIRDYGTIQVPGNDLPPDWTDFKRRNGWLRLAVSTGTPLDLIYTDLSASYPWFFPEDANYGSDQLYALIDGVRAAEPSYWNPNDQYMAAATEYLANQIIDGIIEDVSQDKTFADRAAKRLSDQKIDAKEKLEAQKEKGQAQLDALRAEKNAQIEQERWRAQYDLAYAVHQTRLAADERLNNLKAHYKEAQENARATKAKAELETRVMKIAKRLQNKKLPTPSKALVNEFAGVVDTHARRLTGKTRNALKELRSLYYGLVNKGEILPDKRIENRWQRLDQVQVHDLTIEQLQDLCDGLLYIEHELATAKKEIDSKDRRDVYQKGLQIIGDVRGSSTIKGAKARHNAVVDFLLRYGLDPRRFIRDITGYVDDNPLYLATERINEGQHTMYEYIVKNTQSFNKFMEDKDFMKWLTGKDSAEITIVGGNMETGAPVEAKITPDMRISLYLASKNKSNMRHITSIGGGIKVPDIQLYKEGKIKKAFDDGQIIRLTETGVKRICANMSAQELELANAIYKYFNTTSKNALSGVFEKLKGYMMSTVEDYFPINAVKEFIRQLNDDVKHDASIDNPGWLEDRLDNASGPVMLYDSTSVVLDAIRKHGQFIGLAIPISDFNKLYNMSGPTFNTLGERIGTTGVKDTIQREWGSNTLAYIDKMLADVQNPYTMSDDATKLLRKVRSNYAGATLTMNAGVALKQAGSYPAAAAVLGWEPLVKALGKFGKVDLEAIKESTPLQWLRSQGYSTPEFGDLKNQGRQLPPALNWIQGMDLLTTRKLWKACEIYMQDNHPEMRPGTAEYKETISKLYNRVIEETQPNYTPMQRPQILRHENDLLRDVFGMFKTQVYQNFGMFYESVGNLKAKQRQYDVNPNEQTKAKYDEAKKSFGRTSSALLVQAIVVSAMTLAWNALRGKLGRYKDKEKEKVTVGSFLKRFGTDVAGNIFGMIPFGSDVFSAISSAWTGDKWYGFEGVTPSALTDFVSAIGSAIDLAGKSYDAAKSGDFAEIQQQALKWEKAAETGAKFFGVPAENVMNLIKAVYSNITKTACGKYYGEYLAMLATTPVQNHKGEYYDLLYEAEKNGKMDQFWAIYNSLVALDAMASEKKSTVENIDAALKQREKKDK